ncbi:MAG: TonB-dependent receptor [Acidobacteria bacterium]|nr:TonB-dependent receptor [Acidobacteriota bacterium]
MIRLRCSIYVSQSGSRRTKVMKVTRRAVASLMMLVFLGMLFSIPIHAQNLGRISGTVTDQSGAVVVGAALVAINKETGVRTPATTNEAGNYSIAALLPGRYRVEVELQGFKKYVREPVMVYTATPVGLNIAMEVGEISTELAVTGAPPLLQTEEVSLGTVVEDKMIRDLPVALGRDTAIASGRRQPTSFMNLTPGVSGGEFNKTVNGMQRRGTEVSTDGGAIEAPEHFGQVGNATPPYDAVGEFKVVAGVPEAADGNTSSAVKLTLKSGTNKLHGSASWLNRNDMFDASGFFGGTPTTRRVKPKVRQNEYGFTVGGPVWVPKVYKGKDKTFFFMSYGEFKLRGGGAPRIRTFPTAAFKKGDFSKLTDRQGNLIPIFDPLSAPNDGVSARTQFPGNIIPLNRIDPRALQATALMPTAEIDRSFDNTVAQQPRPTDDWNMSMKIDHSFNSRHKLSGSYWWAHADLLAYNGQPGLTDDGGATHEIGGGSAINYNWLVTSALANELRVNFARSNTGGGPLPGQDLGPNPLNIANYPYKNGNFFVGAEGYARGPGGSGFKYTSGEVGGDSFSDNYSIADSATWIKSTHTFRFGVEHRIRKYRGFGAGYWFPEFRKFQTSNPASPSFGAWGDGMATFLLGDVYEQFGQNDATRNGTVGQRSSWFLQDSWKVTPRLSLTLGLRHDIAPLNKVDNGSSSFDPTVPNSKAGVRLGALRFIGVERFYETDGSQLGPRFGLAYSLNDKTVLRAGYGVLYQIGAAELGCCPGGLRQGFQSGYGLPPAGQPSIPIYNIWKTGAPIDPNVGNLPNTDPTQVNGRGPTWLHPSSTKATRVQQWTINLQREFPKHVVFEARYVGWKAQGLFSTLENLNQVDPRYLSLGSTLTSNINSPAASAAGITAPYAGFTGSVAQALRPFPQYQRIGSLYEALGQANHHSLQLQVQNRLSKDLLFLTNYVWAKTLTDQGLGGGFGVSDQNQYNRKLEKARQLLESPHELKMTWVYELPVGTGKRALSNAPKGVKAVLGGWALAAAQRYSAGSHLAITGGNPLPIFSDTIRPNQVSGTKVQINPSGKFDPKKNLYVAIEAFQPNAPFTFGTAPRVQPDLRGFAYYNEDVNIIKRGELGINETTKYEFRLEIYNIFNRTVFGNPATNFNNRGTFGTVSSQANLPRQMQFGMKILW